MKGSVRESFAFGADGTRLYVRERSFEGTKASGGGIAAPVTLLLCDGLLCDGYIWKYAWDDWGSSHPIAHWNYRGHGRSALPADPDELDVPAHASDLDCVRRHIGDPEVVLVGHSMGCQVVLEAYRKRPEKIAAMVLLCGTAGKVTQTFHGSRVLEQLLPMLMRAAERRPDLVRALWSRIPVSLSSRVALWTGEVDRHTLRPDDLRPYLSHVQDVDVGMFLRMLRAAGDHSAEDLLPSVEVPVLVLAGDRDTFTPSRLATAMAERLPHAELVIVAGGTHVVLLEQSELVDRRVEQFLAETVSTQGAA